MSRTRRAFTLVELLVVIGIIAVLISILLPSLAKAREMAQRVACQSNLRQLYVATVLYQNQYKGYLPAVTIQTATDKSDAVDGRKDTTVLVDQPADTYPGVWFNALPTMMGMAPFNRAGWYPDVDKNPYGPSVFACPSQRGSGRVVQRRTYSMNRFMYQGNLQLYGFFNGQGASGKINGTGLDPIPLDYLRTMPVVQGVFGNFLPDINLRYDAIPLYSDGMYGDMHSWNGDPSTSSGMDAFLEYRALTYFLWYGYKAHFNPLSNPHANGMNAVFLDGHVEYMAQPSAYVGPNGYNEYSNYQPKSFTLWSGNMYIATAPTTVANYACAGAMW